MPLSNKALASGEPSALSESAKSRVPASTTVWPGRNLRVAGFGVCSVRISMGAMWAAAARGSSGEHPLVMHVPAILLMARVAGSPQIMEAPIDRVQVSSIRCALEIPGRFLERTKLRKEILRVLPDLRFRPCLAELRSGARVEPPRRSLGQIGDPRRVRTDHGEIGRILLKLIADRLVRLADGLHAFMSLVHDGPGLITACRRHGDGRYRARRSTRGRPRSVADVRLSVVGLAGFRSSAAQEQRTGDDGQESETRRSRHSCGTFQLSSIILMRPEKSLLPPPRSTNRWKSSSASAPIGV